LSLFPHDGCRSIMTTCFSCGGPLCYVPPRVCEPSYCYGCQALMEDLTSQSVTSREPIPDPGWIPNDPDTMMNNDWPIESKEER